jgi:hypothetical protein
MIVTMSYVHPQHFLIQTHWTNNVLAIKMNPLSDGRDSRVVTNEQQVPSR